MIATRIRAMTGLHWIALFAAILGAWVLLYAMSLPNDLREAGRIRRSPRLLAFMNLFLPPNQVCIVAEAQAKRLMAKCAVISLCRLEQETSSSRRDHFCIGRDVI